MKPIVLPENYNYIGVFLTHRCNMKCSYCINTFDEFTPVKELNTRLLIQGLSRIQTREDLPLSLQGGEPTCHPDFYTIANSLYSNGKHMDLLTNGMFSPVDFMLNISNKVFNRPSKYANIRFSFHEDTMRNKLYPIVLMLKKAGYNVGIWGFKKKYSLLYTLVKMDCKKLGIDYREKDILTTKSKEILKYQDACSKKHREAVLCRPSELLINPAGDIFRCHADLYANRGKIGNILDETVVFLDYLPCDNYGYCNPCDIKTKFNRFQEPGHCSVEVVKTQKGGSLC